MESQLDSNVFNSNTENYVETPNNVESNGTINNDISATAKMLMQKYNGIKQFTQEVLQDKALFSDYNIFATQEDGSNMFFVENDDEAKNLAEIIQGTLIAYRLLEIESQSTDLVLESKVSAILKGEEVAQVLIKLKKVVGGFGSAGLVTSRFLGINRLVSVLKGVLKKEAYNPKILNAFRKGKKIEGTFDDVLEEMGGINSRLSKWGDQVAAKNAAAGLEKQMSGFFCEFKTDETYAYKAIVEPSTNGTLQFLFSANNHKIAKHLYGHTIYRCFISGGKISVQTVGVLPSATLITALTTLPRFEAGMVALSGLKVGNIIGDVLTGDFKDVGGQVLEFFTQFRKAHMSYYNDTDAEAAINEVITNMYGNKENIFGKWAPNYQWQYFMITLGAQSNRLKLGFLNNIGEEIKQSWNEYKFFNKFNFFSIENQTNNVTTDNLGNANASTVAVPDKSSNPEQGLDTHTYTGGNRNKYGVKKESIARDKFKGEVLKLIERINRVEKEGSIII